MRKMLLLLGLLPLLAGLALPQQVALPAAAERLDELVAELSEITGLPQRRKIESSSISRDELKQFLDKRIRDEVDPEEIRIEELLLKKLGLVPEDFDLRSTLVDLYTEQAAAFYDFQLRRLFLLEGIGGFEEAALVHELAHALADQHFRLEKFLDTGDSNDDGAMARMAVMEGQATWLMSEFIVRDMGQSLLDNPGMVDLMARMVASATGEFPVLGNVPLYLRESLLFPYNAGLRFQNAVLRELGTRGFQEVFRRPPQSTREILHPELYLEPEPLLAVRAPRLRREGPYRTLASGNIGELDYSILLRQFADEATAERVAPAWRAGSYRFLEHKRDGDTVLLQASRWADEDAANEFFGHYRDALESKWETFEISEESAGRVSGHGDDGYFQMGLDGVRVWSAEGLREPGAELRGTEDR